MTSSRSLLIASALVTSTLLAVSLPPAHAATSDVDDPAGDGLYGAKLDITSARLDNRQKAVKIRVRVDRLAAGAAFADVKLRGHRRYLVVSDYNPQQGTVLNRLFDSHFDRLPCPRLTASWSTSDDLVDLRIPASCLNDGDYDEVRFRVGTESKTDRDIDFAPTTVDDEGDNEKWVWSPYAERG